MEKFCFLNGKIMPLSEAHVGLYDIGMLRGYGVYDGMAAFGGKPFRFEDHMARFRNSAAALDLNVPYSDEEIRVAILELLEKNRQKDAVIRIILTGGDAISGIRFDQDKPTFYILMEDFIPLPAEVYENGGSLIMHEYRRELPLYKTIHYIEAVRVQEERKKKDAVEVLFVADGQVLEASTSNFFAFIGSKLVTPKEGVLGGITRKVVLELAAGQYEIEERDLTIDEMFKADEAFITSSFKHIVPIVSIDGRPIGEGSIGEKTKNLMKLFAEYVKSR